MGTASIGQTHHAILHSGQQVAVKIQHPEAERNFRADIRTIKQFCQLAQPQHAPYLNEIEKQFMSEFNYVVEAQNLLQIKANLQRSPWAKKVVVPMPVLPLCTREVLVMEYLDGPKLIDGWLNLRAFQ